jgi:hypothetical protein
VGLFAHQKSLVDLSAEGADEHAVIVHIAMSGEFGAAAEVRAIRRLERRLEKAIRRARVGEFDGDEFGMGEAVLYMYGPSKDQLWAAIEPALLKFPVRPVHALLRAGGPDIEAQRVDL